VIASIRVVAYSLCYNSTNNKVYCVTPDDNTVTVIDGATNAVVATVDVGYWPHGLCYNSRDNKVYCANSVGGSISVIDGATDSVVATVPAEGSAWNLCYNPYNNKVYCGSGAPTITVIGGNRDTSLFLECWLPPKRCASFLNWL